MHWVCDVCQERERRKYKVHGSKAIRDQVHSLLVRACITEWMVWDLDDNAELGCSNTTRLYTFIQISQSLGGLVSLLMRD